MSRRAYLFLLFAWFLSFGIIHAQWNIEKCPTKNNLNAIYFKNSHSGWIVGDKGTILKKSKNGWEDYQKPTNENLHSVFMVEENDGWAVGARGTIIHFDGNNWKTFDSPTRKNLFSVSFKDSENGIAVGDFGTILTFKDGSWNLIETGLHGRLFTVSFEKDEAWIGGGLECVNVPIMKMGMNKKEKTLINTFNSYASINSIMFLNPNNGWAVGSPSTILHFDGQQWGRASINDNYSSLKSVYFSDENNGISVGYQGSILIYNDGTWIKENPLVTQDLSGCTKIGNSFYAIGDSGTIITRKLVEYNDLKSLPENNSGRIKVFPNPCDEVLNIIFPGGNDYTTMLISISNTNGQILIQKELISGVGNLSNTIVTSGLKNGLYFLQSVSGSKTSTVSFVIKH